MDPTRKSSTRVLKALIAFEAAWRNGQKPQVHAYVQTVPEDEQSEAESALREMQERLQSQSTKQLHDSASGSTPLATTMQLPQQRADLQETRAEESKLVAGLPRSFGKYTIIELVGKGCLLYTSPSPRDRTRSRMPSSA